MRLVRRTRKPHIVDEESLLASLSPEGLRAWEQLSAEAHGEVCDWALKPRWQRRRRERADEVDRSLRLQVRASGLDGHVAADASLAVGLWPWL